MKFTMRWFGKDYDPVSLEKIRQVPGVYGVITTLYGTPVGDIWDKDELFTLKKQAEDSGLVIAGIESLGVHDSIKIGSQDRDKYIDNYIKSLEIIAEAGIDLVVYNFMPVFDWTRSDLAKKRPDGSTVLAYDQKIIDKVNPLNMADLINEKADGFLLPGWEPERLSKIKELFNAYRDINEEKLFSNLEYFLKAVIPICEKLNIKLAIHPDDPPWPVFGLPRIMKNKEDILRLVKTADSPCNGINLCTGSLGANPDNDIPDIIMSLKDKIHFAHIRNVKHNGKYNFEESAHLSCDGSLDMYKIVKAFYDIGFTGPVRPDHGRSIWGEVSIPGYGLYDRAIGIGYLQGLWDAISNEQLREEREDYVKRI